MPARLWRRVRRTREPSLNVRFVVRGLLVGLPVALLLATAAMAQFGWSATFGRPADATPLPPTISLPRGQTPPGQVTFEEWVSYADQLPSRVGCGFFLQANDAQVIGVTTAHSLALSDNGDSLESISFRLPHSGVDFATFAATLGPPGQARTGDDLTVDYALVVPTRSVGPAWVLEADPRGAPQPGERLTLVKCEADPHGQRVEMRGTVQTVTPQGFWVLMDDPATLSTMSGSGSPFFSQHTGKVVGMLIAGTIRADHALFGAHHVESIVDLARVRLASDPTPSTPLSETPDPQLGNEFAVDVHVRRGGNGNPILTIEFVNRSPRTAFLPICGPWEVFRVNDPDRPIWFLACETDYLGHRVEAGTSWVNELELSEAAGSVAVRTSVFSGCDLGQPKELGPNDTFFGSFDACASRIVVTSSPFHLP